MENIFRAVRALAPTELLGFFRCGNICLELAFFGFPQQEQIFRFRNLFKNTQLFRQIIGILLQLGQGRVMLMDVADELTQLFVVFLL